MKIGWATTNGYDLHLLTGTVSPRLDHRLFILDDLDNAQRVDKAPGVTRSFTARFAGAPSAHGVTMDPATGEITVKSTMPTPRLRSFLVTAEVNHPSFTFRLRLRVYVHASISAAWLTPNPLTIRESPNAMRLTLLARFDDGVIGDITNWSPWSPPLTTGSQPDRTFVRRALSNAPILKWISRTDESDENFNAVDVGIHTGMLTGVRPGERATVVVTHPGGEARAKVNVDVPWSATAVHLKHLAGPGVSALNDARVPNILLLPDGFTDNGTDQRDFEQHARTVVSRLAQRAHMRPFDLLLQNKRINWFTAWLPSRQAGITIGQELCPLPSVGAIEAKPVEGPTLDTPPSAWTLGNLINAVGLPVPTQDTPGSPLGTDASGRVHDWRTVYGTDIAAAKISPLVYNEWLALSGRVLLNERDTAFHMLSSSRPRVDGEGVADVALNPRRLHVADLDAFLDSLTTEHGDPIPKLWSTDARDEGLLVILCRTHSYAGFNSFRSRKARLVAVSLLNLETHRIEARTNGPGFDIVPDPVPASVHPHTWTTTAHELSHSWGLSDEYGGHKLVNLRSVADSPNVQPRKELLDGSGRLTTNWLKWLWPRIASAGVIAAAPTPTGDRFIVRLRPGHARPLELRKLQGVGTVRVAGFRIGDVVRLRTRPLLPTSAVSPRTSPRLRVMDVRGDELELAWVSPASALLPFSFPVDSIVLLPVRARDPAPGVLADDLELVAASVRARIDTTHNSLNANPLPGEVASGAVDAPNRPVPDVLLVQPTPSTNWPGRAAPKPPRYSSWVIGIVENGDGSNTEIVHPSGVCVMNAPQIFDDRKGGPIKSYQFCHVCRYALVDRLDPTQHGRIDRDYAPRYPA